MEKYKKTDLKVTVPYIQGLSERLKRALKKFAINTYFQSNHILEKSLINKKDLDKIENLSNVVYLIKCKECNEIYFRETGSRLKKNL